MNVFLIVIHRDLTSKNPKPSPAELKEALQPYQQWIQHLADADKLVAPPKRWDLEGKVVSHGKKVKKGPYVDGITSIGGLLLIKATDYDEAVTLAKLCPIIKYGAVVEVRMALPTA
ncbi:hypothetical protein GCM10027566_18160 [Arachidicoccus ginsenosidivorans]|uniref:Transcription initiation protein n=1 Tax=Arachidicoccus ginsenosidivorans TaxID=496057 RepID=A0A5B8VGK2_9BACT|nr:YciI family protein [Arachidicoccus ginsenosidivorans]QEC70727.1 transcription initiation protein [Arachidicoccus ginsenosidivorans]